MIDQTIESETGPAEATPLASLLDDGGAADVPASWSFDNDGDGHVPPMTADEIAALALVLQAHTAAHQISSMELRALLEFLMAGDCGTGLWSAPMMNIKARFHEAMERHGSVLNRVAADLVDQINQDPELRKEATALLVALLFMPGDHNEPDDDTVFVEEPGTAFEDAESLARAILQTMPR